MKRTFTIERTDEYTGEYPYTPDELASAEYVVWLDNGDYHLLQTVADVIGLIGDELFLAGFADA